MSFPPSAPASLPELDAEYAHYRARVARRLFFTELLKAIEAAPAVEEVHLRAGLPFASIACPMEDWRKHRDMQMASYFSTSGSSRHPSHYGTLEERKIAEGLAPFAAVMRAAEEKLMPANALVDALAAHIPPTDPRRILPLCLTREDALLACRQFMENPDWICTPAALQELKLDTAVSPGAPLPRPRV